MSEFDKLSGCLGQPFDLQLQSIVAGSARHWVLYAVPLLLELEVLRVECRTVEELDDLLTRLRTTGASEESLRIGRNAVVERNVNSELGTCHLSPNDQVFLKLEPVPGLTADDVNHLSLDEEEQGSD